MKGYKILGLMTIVTLFATSTVQGFAATEIDPTSTVATQIQVAATTDIKTTPDGMYQYQIANNKATITKYVGLESTITIPETIENCPVVAIANYAFLRSSTIINVTIPQDLTIGIGAFNQSTIQTVDMPNITSIGEQAFIGARNLIKVSAPKVTTIYSDAFSSCKALTTTDFPSVTTLKHNAFYECSSLETINLPVATTLEHVVFSQCTKLTSITIPKVTTLQNQVFMYTNLKNIDLSVVTSMGSEVFYGCSNLTDITVSNSLSPVEANVFTGTNINSVTINYGANGIDNVTAATWDTFVANILKLNPDLIDGKYVTNNNNDIKEFKDGFTYSITANGATIVSYSGDATELTIPETINGIDVVGIGASAFKNNSTLIKLTIPKTLAIGEEAFSNCSSLNSIVISNDIETAGINAFTDSPINSVTMDCGDENISYVTNNDFQSFLDKLTDLKQSDVTTKIVKNTEWSRNLPDLTPPEIIMEGDMEMTIPQNSVYEDLGATASDDSRADIEVITDNKVNTSIIGDYTVTYTAYDPSGNKATATRIVHVEDKIAPVITLTDPNPKTMILEEKYVEPGYTITDNSGEVIDPVIVNNVDSSKVGSYTVTYTATDSAGNTTTAVRFVNVIYNYSGVLNPLSDTNNTKNVFKAGSVIPVKFKLSNIYGRSISTSKTTLSYAKVINDKVGEFKPANNIVFLINDNTFRYDLFTKQYIFNMSTFGLSKGIYVLQITLDDGRTFENVQITLK